MQLSFQFNKWKEKLLELVEKDHKKKLKNYNKKSIKLNKT